MEREREREPNMNFDFLFAESRRFFFYCFFLFHSEIAGGVTGLIFGGNDKYIN